MNIYSYTKSQLRRFNTDPQLFSLSNDAIPILMGLFIFLNPFPHITTIKEICFYLSLLIVLVLIFFKKTAFSFKTPLSVPLLLFLSWALLTTFFALDKENSIHDIYSHLLKYLIFYYLMFNSFNSKERLLRLSWLIVISSSIFSLGALCHDYLILGNKLSTRFGLTFVQTPTNLIGVITLSAIILSLYLLLTETTLFQKIVLVSCLLPLSTVTFLTQTRSNVIALGAALILLFPINRKAMLVALGLVLLLTATTHPKARWRPNYLLNNERIGTTYLIYEITKDYPITGIGFGMLTYGSKIDLDAYRQRIPSEYRPPILNIPHNIFLSIAVRVGPVGLVLFLYVLFVSVKMCLGIIRQAKDIFLRKWTFCALSLLVMFLIKGSFEPVLTHLTEVVFYTIFAMITILWRLNLASNQA